MKVVDSSGWLEYFGKGANGERFAPAIQDSQNLLVPVICLYEVFKRVTLERGEDDALQAAALMMTGTVIEINPGLAISAAQLSIELRMPMSDSFILAAARLYQAELWTQDEHFKGLEQVVYIEKPRATG